MCQPRGAARLRDTSVPQDASYAHRLTVFSPLVMLSSWNNLEGERPEPLPHSQVCSKTTEKEAEGSGFSSALAQVAAVAPRPALTARASRHLVILSPLRKQASAPPPQAPPCSALTLRLPLLTPLSAARAHSSPCRNDSICQPVIFQHGVPCGPKSLSQVT